ncbi:DUF3443 family protein [Paraburkholderia xenovorans]|uniref:DUF3443 family protein n=1 Tax=Paraburkholderia xenovorans TaxID=36873 RepID=UPI0038B93942
MKAGIVVAFSVALLLSACGDDLSSTPAVEKVNNVVPVTVGKGDGTAGGNLPTTTVTICVPGTSQCQSIDNVLIDTGSSGLRLFARDVSLSLPAVTLNGSSLSAQAGFLDGTLLRGDVKRADIKLAGEIATSVPIHVVTDRSLPGDPAAAQAKLGSPTNGILGVSHAIQDCGDKCSGDATQYETYYVSEQGKTRFVPVPLADQVTNPIALFPVHNNGFLLDLPPLTDGRPDKLTGTMVFGIGTASNNQLGSASVLTLDASGNISTVFNGRSLPNSFIDSGTQILIFPFEGGPVCASEPDFYCPTSTQTLSAEMVGANGVHKLVSFQIESPESVDPNRSAANIGKSSDLAQGSFLWGMPFFFGRKVFVALDGKATPGGVGPYNAF